MEEVVGKLGSPQLDGQSGIENLKVINGRVPLEYLGGKVTWYALPGVRAPQSDMQASI